VASASTSHGWSTRTATANGTTMPLPVPPPLGRGTYDEVDRGGAGGSSGCASPTSSTGIQSSMAKRRRQAWQSRACSASA
jgi:hypothetical protein